MGFEYGSHWTEMGKHAKPNPALAISHPQPQRVIVGLGVLVIKDGLVLVGKRKGSHGAGKWAFPGGHQDHGESWEECGPREILEETGMTVQFRYFDPDRLQKFMCVTDDHMKADNRHYNTVYIVCDWVSGEPELKEPHKCEGWKWVTFQGILELLSPEAREHYEKNGTQYETEHWFPIPHIARNLAKIGLKNS
jgi:8-oxo-dGTP diphosphatase